MAGAPVAPTKPKLIDAICEELADRLRYEFALSGDDVEVGEAIERLLRRRKLLGRNTNCWAAFMELVIKESHAIELHAGGRGMERFAAAQAASRRENTQ
jgi:hypothetical protein